MLLAGQPACALLALLCALLALLRPFAMPMDLNDGWWLQSLQLAIEDINVHSGMWKSTV